MRCITNVIAALMCALPAVAMGSHEEQALDSLVRQGHEHQLYMSHDGRIRRLTGEFDVGVDPRSDASLLSGARRFVAALGTRHDELLCNQSRLIVPPFARTSARPMVMLSCVQAVDGVAVIDSDTMFLFDAVDGALLAASGLPLHGPVAVAPAFRSSPARVAASLGIAVDDATITRILSRSLDAALWRVVLPGREVLVNDATGSIVSDRDTTLSSQGYAPIRHYPYTNDDHQSRQSRVSATGQLKYVKSGSLCTWTLETDGSSNTRKLNRILINGGTTNQAQLTSTGASCESSPPTFYWTGGHSVVYNRQAHIYYWAEKIHAFGATVWGSVTPNQTYDLTFDIDKSTACGASASCYDSSSKSVFFEDTFLRPMAVVFHEFGHYWHHLYGSMTIGTCSFDTDERQQIIETVADLFAGSAAMYNYPPTIHYHVDSNLEFTHVTADGAVQHADLCSGDYHVYGKFFEVAWREMSGNRNCSTATCTTSSSFWGSSIGWDDQSDPLWSMTSALSSALSATPYNYDDLAYWVWYFMYYNQGRTTIANNMKSVMVHHGITTW